MRRLSRFYNTSKLDKYFPNKTHSSYISFVRNNKQNMLTRNLKEPGLGVDYKPNQFNCNNIENSSLEDTINNPNGNENIYDEMTQDMLSQIPGSDHLKGKDIEEVTGKDKDNLITSKQLETIKKIRDLENK
jgi:hypothetical protein